MEEGKKFTGRQLVKDNGQGELRVIKIQFVIGWQVSENGQTFFFFLCS